MPAASGNEGTDTINSVPIILSFPVFPDPIDSSGQSIVSFDSQEDTVNMPLWFWQKIVLYVLSVDEVESIYSAYVSDSAAQR